MVSVHQFYNWIRSNKLAPISVKLKVMQACVSSSLLHNCETFADKLPDNLERTYISMIKCCLGVGNSSPNKLVILESGMQNVKSIIAMRQYKFFKRYKENMVNGSIRKSVFDYITQENSYSTYYFNLLSSYTNANEIRNHYKSTLQNEITILAANDENYKYGIYTKFNPDLSIPNVSKSYSHLFAKLRLSSHSFPIETGRWNRIPRKERLCNTCKVLGDEIHYIYIFAHL